MHAIVGLGNPGERYENSRHNAGRIVLQNIQKSGAFSKWEKSKYGNALYSHGEVGGEEVELILPETYMNKSGDTVRYVVKKHELQPEQVIVVYDDVDLPFGEMKLSVGRGSGGHNGVESIIKALKSKDFPRIRVGIAGRSLFGFGAPRRPTGSEMSSYVLGRLRGKEARALEAMTEEVEKVLEVIVKGGVEKAMNQFNK